MQVIQIGAFSGRVDGFCDAPIQSACYRRIASESWILENYSGVADNLQ